jgi:tetratricopeptide (TPR) repeat protein
MTAPSPDRRGPATLAPIGQGAVSPTAPEAADEALGLRDQALAALDEGDPAQALEFAGEAVGILAAGGLRGGLDEVAVLIARAEIEEALDRFDDARDTTATAIAILTGRVGEDADDDTVTLWCQAQERMAGLERMAGDFDTAAARLRDVLDRASAALGEASLPVVSAANALGMVHKYTADFDAAETAYRRATDAVAGLADPDPLLEAGLLHNRGGLAHSRGDAATGIPLAERGAALRADVLGADHPDVARDLNALGALYHLAGRYDDAARAYDRALIVFEDSYGPDHFEVAMTCANLAVLHGDQGEYGRAESVGRRSLEILTAVLGPDDAEVGLTLLNLAVAVAGQGKTTEAADLASRAAAILADRLPPGHPHVLAAAEAARSYRPSA